MNTPDCDEDDCTEKADSVCYQCGLFLCHEHAVDLGGLCDECGNPMEDI